MSTLRELLSTYGQDELLEQFIRISPRTYDEFIDTLYADLDYIVGLIEADAKDFESAGEDELNREIVRLLQARFHQASHDHDEGGHVDVRVVSRSGKFSWLAEAKLDKGAAYLQKGVHQLADRYARGTPGHHCGGFLIYVQKSRCAERFKNWRDGFSQQTADFKNLSIDDCPQRTEYSFYSNFILPRIGEGPPPYRIRHMAVSAFREANTHP